MTAQLSRERLEALANLQSLECMALPASHAESAAMARMLLAGMSGDPVYQLSESWNGQSFSGWKDCTKEEFNAAIPCGCERMRRVLYAAPPAPVAVPDLKELEAILDWILMLPCPTPKATHFAKRLAVVIDTCRAAMLKAWPVTGWIKCSERIPPLNDGQIWIYSPTRGVKFMFALSASGAYYDTCDSEEDITDATHWMPIAAPAAPEQEV